MARNIKRRKKVRAVKWAELFQMIQNGNKHKESQELRAVKWPELFQMIQNGKKHKEAKKIKGREVGGLISNDSKWQQT